MHLPGIDKIPPIWIQRSPESQASQPDGPTGGVGQRDGVGPFFWVSDQDELAYPAHYTVLETTSWDSISAPGIFF